MNSRRSTDVDPKGVRVVSATRTERLVAGEDVNAGIGRLDTVVPVEEEVSTEGFVVDVEAEVLGQLMNVQFVEDVFGIGSFGIPVTVIGVLEGFLGGVLYSNVAGVGSEGFAVLFDE